MSHIKKYAKIKDFCNVVKLSEDTKISEFNQYHKSDQKSFIIYADLESLIEKWMDLKNNPENSSTTKLSEHISSGLSVPTILSFKAIENIHGVYRGKDYMKKFCESLKAHTIKIINFEIKKMKLLTNKQQKSYENAKICYICNEKFEDKYAKDKKYCKVKDHCHYTGE